jgi:hypothetical protein
MQNTNTNGYAPRKLVHVFIITLIAIAVLFMYACDSSTELEHPTLENNKIM